MKPCTEEAEPAMWPSGSIDTVLKFEPIQPNWNIARENRTRYAASGNGAVIDQMNHTALTSMKPISAL